jgi:tRNA uridine 5-carboxymethylaminomethyl modification enzyme
MRLTEKGHEIGLIDNCRYNKFVQKKEMIREEIERVEHTHIGTNQQVQSCLKKLGSTELKSSATLAELIRRPELSYEMLCEIDPERPQLPEEVGEQVNICIKYDGYLQRQMKQVEQFKKLEQKKIPETIDYDTVPSLRIEARQKLKEFRPASIGQASRIAGVSPADISVLLVYLEKR